MGLSNIEVYYITDPSEESIKNMGAVFHEQLKKKYNSVDFTLSFLSGYSIDDVTKLELFNTHGNIDADVQFYEVKETKTGKEELEFFFEQYNQINNILKYTMSFNNNIIFRILPSEMMNALHQRIFGTAVQYNPVEMIHMIGRGVTQDHKMFIIGKEDILGNKNSIDTTVTGLYINLMRK